MATVKDTFGTTTALTITLNSLANSVAGVGRQSAMVDNTSDKFTSALVSLSFKVGTTPTANTPISVYLLRYDNVSVADDGAGTGDAAITVKNAAPLGTLICNAITTGAVYSGIFDTSSLGALGPKWGIAVVNGTGVTSDSTSGNFVASYTGVYKTVA